LGNPQERKKGFRGSQEKQSGREGDQQTSTAAEIKKEHHQRGGKGKAQGFKTLAPCIKKVNQKELEESGQNEKLED